MTRWPGNWTVRWESGSCFTTRNTGTSRRHVSAKRPISSIASTLWNDPYYRSAPLQPILPLEKEQHRGSDCRHGQEHGRITPTRPQFGHMLEVHPIDAGDKTQRHENSRNDGEHFHHGIEAITHARQINLQHRRHHFTQAFDRVDDLHHMVVDVSKE